MAKLRYEAVYDVSKNEKLQILVSLYEFQEKNMFYIYCAPLDLYGYGINEVDARNSFNIVLAEFFKYTINKKTFEKELTRLGWKITKSRRKPAYVAPDIEKLLIDNEEFQDILQNKDYKKTSQKIEIPVLA